MVLIKTSHLIHVKFFRSLEIKRRGTIMNYVEYESVGIEEFTSKKEGRRSGGERVWATKSPAA